MDPSTGGGGGIQYLDEDPEIGRVFSDGLTDDVRGTVANSASGMAALG